VTIHRCSLPAAAQKAAETAEQVSALAANLMLIALFTKPANSAKQGYRSCSFSPTFP